MGILLKLELLTDKECLTIKGGIEKIEIACEKIETVM